MKTFATVLGFAVLAVAARPAAANNYTECMKLIDMAPKRAYDLASQWRDYGGGLPSEHCMALALFELGQYEKSAQMLEELARRAKQETRAAQAKPNPTEEAVNGAQDEAPPAQVPPTLSIDLLAQAGNAWLMAGKNEKAFTVLSEALSEKAVTDQQAAQILIDRARARVELGNLEGAVTDLDEAIKRGGPQADALTYRASAHRALGQFASARADLDQALAMDSTNVEALLEEGNLNEAIGNTQAAIVDWIQVTKLSPDTLAGRAAADSIKKARALEAKGGDGTDEAAADDGKAAPAEAKGDERTPKEAAPAKEANPPTPAAH
ncbi:MAG: tetratricopeptide repeat protein [Alphaproteobacteria bacterium]|nr:tetratricopeptide repeat protein [Alphaproteobacteria bacterium]